MDSPFIGAAAAFVLGCLISYFNYLMSRKILIKKSEMFVSFFSARFLISVSYMIILFALSRVLPWDSVPLLLGGAAGITLPNFFFTSLLVKLNDSLPKNTNTNNDKNKEKPDSDGKE